MFKKFFWLLLLIGMISCSKDDEVREAHSATIEQLWTVDSPFPLYIMRLSDGVNASMLRHRYRHELHRGDKIRYELSSLYPNEIAKINGCETGTTDDNVLGGGLVAGNLVASDPIEGDVISVFEMKWRYYCVSMFLVPYESCFIETPERLIYVKKAKLNSEICPGDRIVYNVYTFFPHEVLAMKKLN